MAALVAAIALALLTLSPNEGLSAAQEKVDSPQSGDTQAEAPPEPDEPTEGRSPADAAVKRGLQVTTVGDAEGRVEESLALGATVALGGQGQPYDLSRVTLFFDLTPRVGGRTKSYGPVPVDATGRGSLDLPAGLTANVYDLVVRLDPANGQFQAEPSAPATLAVYDPEAGRTAGNGLVEDGDMMATFGFSAGYEAGKRLTGEVDYGYQEGSDRFTLRSGSLRWLVMAQGAAILRGDATVNDSPGYSFELAAADNGEPGQDDTLGIRIWNPDGSLLHELKPVVLGPGNGNVIVPRPVEVDTIALAVVAQQGGTLDYRARIKLAPAARAVTVEALVASGTEMVKGTCMLDGRLIADPIKRPADANRTSYQFRLGYLAAGPHALTYQGRVDLSRPCPGQKVTNSVNLIYNGQREADSSVDTPMECAVPTATPVASTGPVRVQPRSSTNWVANLDLVRPLLPIHVCEGLNVSRDWDAARYLAESSSQEACKTLAAALLAARLNVKAGAEHGSIDSVITQAALFLMVHSYWGNPQGGEHDRALTLRDQLAAYNSSGTP
jgi:hypothetical protein